MVTNIVYFDMIVEEREHLKTKIQSDIQELRSTIKELEAKTQAISPDCSLGRLTRLEAINEAEVNKRILTDSRQRFDRLRLALGRIDKEEYGLCEVCDEPIPYARLQIMPEMRVCIECAEELG
jgi:DnaK suppressor protein